MTTTMGELREVARGWRWGKRPLVPRSAETFRPTVIPKEFPTEWARTPVARAAREVILSSVLGPLVRGETRVRVHGVDVLEDLAPPVIFVSNHGSHLDAPLLLCTMPKA